MASGIPSPDHSASADETLGAGISARALPESGEKRVTAGVLAALIIAAMFVPWWKTAYPLRYETEQLNGWDLLVIGFNAGGYAPLTGFSGFGNVLLGAVPTVVPLLLAVLLAVRAIRPRAIPASTVALWALLSVLTTGWLLVLGWTQVNAMFGEYPVTWGALIVAMVSVFTTIAMFNWWRRGERNLYPRRGRMRLGSREYEEAEPTTIDELIESENTSGEDSTSDDSTR